jgi:hypothetical protein
MTRRQTLTIDNPRWPEFVAQLKPVKRNAGLQRRLDYGFEIIDVLMQMEGVDVRATIKYIRDVCHGDPVRWTKTHGSTVADRAAALDAPPALEATGGK